MPVYTVAGVAVEFPFEAYDVQLLYMEKVVLALQRGEHALLESPTGTGKTLCLLCAALGWRRQTEREASASTAAQQRPVTAWADQGAAGGTSRLPRIIYMSRTHSQLKQVVRQLRMTVHRPTVCVLGSREQMCVHPDVRGKTGVEQVSCCQALVAAQACSFHNELQRRKGPARTAQVPHPERSKPAAARELPDIEDFVQSASSERLCPFHFARELQTQSEVLFMPYNYLVDPAMRGALNISVAHDVLVFDEAHNVEKACAEAASFDLGPSDFAGAVKEIDRVISLASSGAADADVEEGCTAPEEGEAGAWLSMRQLVLDMEEAIAGLPLRPAPQGGSPRYTGDGLALHALLAPLNITAETSDTVIAMCDDAGKKLVQAARWGSSAHHLRRFADLLRVVFGTASEPSTYRVCVTEAAELSGAAGRGAATASKGARRMLGYWCQDPGVGMRALVAGGVRSVLLTSGTLSPLGSFASELGIPFPHRLENPHVIRAKQILVGVVPSGPSSVELTSKFTHRETPEYKAELGNALVNVARLVPQGVLVFFPSMAALSGAAEQWGKRGSDGGPTVLERLEKHKRVIIEPRGQAEVIERFKEHVAIAERTGVGGAVLFAVCRGRLSEGVDFSDSACRAVVITGLPLPPVYDPKVALKREYLDVCRRHSTGRLSGHEWYDQQAMRAVNQAIGRVIRHVRDYGAVLLFESRFKLPKYREGLSVWLRAHVRVFDQFGQVAVALPRFYREATPDGPTPEQRRLAEAVAQRQSASQAAPTAPARQRENLQCRPAVPVASAPAPPPLLDVLQAARGQRSRCTPLRAPPQQQALAALPTPTGEKHEQQPRQQQQPPPPPPLQTLQQPRLQQATGCGGGPEPAKRARTHPGASESAATPKAQELVEMARSVLSKAEFKEYIAMLRALKELGPHGAANGDGIAAVRAQARAIFGPAEYAAVAESTLRFVPPQLRGPLRSAFLPVAAAAMSTDAGSRGGTSIGLSINRLAKPPCAKAFMQSAEALIGSVAAFRDFQTAIGPLLSQLKACSPADAEHVLGKVHALFWSVPALRKLRASFAAFLPQEHARGWAQTCASFAYREEQSTT